MTYKRRKAIPIRAGYKVVGRVLGDEFQKSVDGRLHFLRTPLSIAFDISSLEDARDYGATIVKIYDTDTHNNHYALISTIFEKGFRFNRGSGEQIGLLMSYWSAERPEEQPTLFMEREVV